MAALNWLNSLPNVSIGTRMHVGYNSLSMKKYVQDGNERFTSSAETDRHAVAV